MRNDYTRRAECFIGNEVDLSRNPANELKMSNLDSSVHNAVFQPAAVHRLRLSGPGSLLTLFWWLNKGFFFFFSFPEPLHDPSAPLFKSSPHSWVSGVDSYSPCALMSAAAVARVTPARATYELVVWFCCRSPSFWSRRLLSFSTPFEAKKTKRYLKTFFLFLFILFFVLWVITARLSCCKLSLCSHDDSRVP